MEQAASSTDGALDPGAAPTLPGSFRSMAQAEERGAGGVSSTPTGSGNHDDDMAVLARARRTVQEAAAAGGEPSGGERDTLQEALQQEAVLPLRAAIRESLERATIAMDPLVRRDVWQHVLPRAARLLIDTLGLPSTDGAAAVVASWLDSGSPYGSFDDDDDNDDEEEEEEEEEEAGEDDDDNDDAAPSNFDTSLPAQHAYLGDGTDSLPIGLAEGELEPGVAYELPLLLLPESVPLPDTRLPLVVMHAAELLALERSMHEGPTRGLIAVAHWPAGGHRDRDAPQRTWRRVGCVAQVKQLQQPQRGRLHALLWVRQRALLTVRLPTGTHSIEDVQALLAMATLLPEPALRALPRPVAEGAAFWGAAAARPLDPQRLAGRALQLCASVVPAGTQGPASRASLDPQQLSFWLAANLPLPNKARQALLEAPSACHRLRRELELLQALGALGCSACASQVARTEDAICMSLDGMGGTFANPAGFVHDVITFRAARGVLARGAPSTEACWFPGYAWQHCLCAGCDSHLGWRYCALTPELHPSKFWGLRRTAIAYRAAQQSQAAHQGSQ